MILTESTSTVAESVVGKRTCPGCGYPCLEVERDDGKQKLRYFSAHTDPRPDDSGRKLYASCAAAGPRGLAAKVVTRG